MKLGYRKPSIKKSISARTTGRAKRIVKSSINPSYGKKGMGLLNNPEKSVYNKIYNKTTVGYKDVFNESSNQNFMEDSNQSFLYEPIGQFMVGCILIVVIIGFPILIFYSIISSFFN